MKGISTNRQTGSAAACFKRNGYDFIIRYYSEHTSSSTKRLTAAEARAISGADVDIVTVYEDNADHIGYLTRARGRSDAIYAYNYALATIGQPAGSAVYFAIDFDPDDHDNPNDVRKFLAAVHIYFEGVNDGFNQAGNQQPIYDIGVYGPGVACESLKATFSFVKYTWLAGSPGWMGHDTYTDWNLKQSHAPSALCNLGTGWEQNESKGAFGNFRIMHVE